MKQVKQEQKKNSGPKVSPAKQLAAVAAALAMSALLILGILAIGANAYLDGHVAATMTHVSAVVGAFL